MWLKDFAIRTFGAHDKAVLLAGLGCGIAAAAVAIGLLTRRRLAWGVAGLAGFGAVGVAAALTRPMADPVDTLPTVAGAACGMAALAVLGRTARREVAPDRRQVLLCRRRGRGRRGGRMVAGRVLLRRDDVSAVRARLRPPLRPTGLARSCGAQVKVPGMPPFRTPNRDFYRVDTALVLPQVDPRDWTLRIHGMVARPVELTFEDLLNLDLVERHITLSCVSNQVGGDLAGNARWLGAPLGPLLRRAGCCRAPTSSCPARPTA